MTAGCRRRAGRVVTLSVLALGTAACATTRPSRTSAGSTGRSSANHVSAEQIERSGARTMWDALYRTVPFVTFLETKTANPARLGRRGRSSLTFKDEPHVFLDETRVTDLNLLRQLSASEIGSIEVVSGIDATTRYGTDFGDGAIVIRTKSGRAARR